ncbi:MAG: hypothetical protein IKQ59_04105 [Prevotella sp.]|nr:hypothetical protein [Prevotella sp.]
MPKQERGEAGSITPRSCKAVWHGQRKVTVVSNHRDEEPAYGCLMAGAKMAGGQAGLVLRKATRTLPHRWKGGS